MGLGLVVGRDYRRHAGSRKDGGSIGAQHGVRKYAVTTAYKSQTIRFGDAIFVLAGAVHRFETFTDNYSARVIFHGPEGGDAAST